MKGDKILIEQHHYDAARKIIDKVLNDIEDSEKYAITVAGESGSGKSETANALKQLLEEEGIKCVVLGQDDYFILPPKTNDSKRREEFAWVGTNEVNLNLLNSHVLSILKGASELEKPLVDYDKDCVESEKISTDDIKVVIAEGTYTSLLRNVHNKVFIARNRLETMEAREKRNRGNEVGDPFIEDVLKLEHKIISGHINLADFVIDKDYRVEFS
ncbi:MAG: zeta toxin family protein [Clostridiales bacterium]